MRKLSSALTFWNKRVYPFLVLAAVLGIAMATWRQPAVPRGFDWLPLLLAGLAAALGMLSWRYLQADLIDEVWLDGDSLRLRSRGEEARMPLATLVTVKAQHWFSPQRIVVEFNRDSPFGRRITFLPAGLNFTFVASPIAAELRQRALAAGARLTP